MLSRAVGKGIGLATEYNAHRKRSKSRSPDPNAAPSPAAGDAPTTPSADPTGHIEDEEAWDIDDAQDDEPKDVQRGLQEAKSVKQLLEAFQHLHPAPDPPRATASLSLPIILPQRRPHHRDRGFVRAYAPDLAAEGIDQRLFFDFLDGFEKAIRLHPIFHAVNLAVWGAVKAIDLTAGISLTVHAVAFAVHTSIEASRRGVIIHETNRYLDGVNEGFFKPRGLYAMIMTYKPQSSDAITDVKPSSDVASSVAARNEGHGGSLNRSSGKTHGELALPESAPLVFPHFDALSEEQKEGKLKQAGSFLNDYNDRRARARFVLFPALCEALRAKTNDVSQDMDHPDSKLSVPGTDFATTYGDPNSPAVNGGVMGLVTAGKRPGIRYRLQNRRGKSGEKKPKGSKRMMQQNVYYLMIVNMPSQAELDEATRAQNRVDS